MKYYFTITGTRFHYGQHFFEKGMKVRLEKEQDNRYDREAIKVMVKGLGHVGYVANSSHTVIGDSYSAGRLYDKIGNKAKGKVVMISERGILCVLKDKKEKQSPDMPISADGLGQEEATDGMPE